MNSCAIIPCYRVSAHIESVVKGLRGYVDHVFVVDDCCPEQSGKLIEEAPNFNSFATVIYHQENKGVGGAVVTGYTTAENAGFDILIKVDGDGQMNPEHIPALIEPIIAGEADYCKGNRFFAPDYLAAMPKGRLIGNAGLSFMSKLTTGQWHVMDPTNGFTAIHAKILPWLHTELLQERYFFETDMLYRLGTIDAVVQDIPMPSIYGEEESNLSPLKSLLEFGYHHTGLLFKRIFYSYILRNFNLATLFLITAIPLIIFGVIFGAYHWSLSIQTQEVASTGTIMLAAMPLVLGFQLLFAFFHFDMTRRPSKALWRKLGAQAGIKKPQQKLRLYG